MKRVVGTEYSQKIFWDERRAAGDGVPVESRLKWQWLINRSVELSVVPNSASAALIQQYARRADDTAVEFELILVGSVIWDVEIRSLKEAEITWERRCSQCVSCQQHTNCHIGPTRHATNS